MGLDTFKQSYYSFDVNTLFCFQICDTEELVSIGNFKTPIPHLLQLSCKHSMKLCNHRNLVHIIVLLFSLLSNVFIHGNPDHIMFSFLLFLFLSYVYPWQPGSYYVFAFALFVSELCVSSLDHIKFSLLLFSFLSYVYPCQPGSYYVFVFVAI